MTSIDWGLEISARVWQGSTEPRLEAGAAQLAEFVTPVGERVVIGSAGGTSPRKHGVDNFEVLSDFFSAATDALQRSAAERVLTLGGDCTVEVASASYLASVHPDLRVVWIDAHADLNTPDSSPSGHAHGMPLRMIMGDGHPDLIAGHPVEADHCMLLGIRSMDEPEEELVERFSIPLHSSEQLNSDLTLFLADLERWLPEGAPLFIHLDLDVLNPEIWPAVAVPEPGGLSLATLESIVTALRARGDVVGLGITEYVPQIPHDESVLGSLLRTLGVETTLEVETSLEIESTLEVETPRE